MNIKKIKLVIQILLVVALISCFEIPDLNGIENSVSINGINKQFYIESKTWGLAGNHEEIKLVSKENCDTITFYTDQIFYEIKGTDTLAIHTNSSSFFEKPSKFCETIFLEIYELKYFDDIKEMERTFKEKGLKRITIYDEK